VKIIDGDCMITKPKKLTPASIISQKKWGKMSVVTKKKIRKTLKDIDKDGVPDKYDCRPKNKRKQESFLSSDIMYLNSNPDIQLGEKIGMGSTGDVFAIKGNNNLVVKVPGGAIDSGSGISLTHARKARVGIEQEIGIYNKLNLEDEPLCSPTRVVNLGHNSVLKGDMIGLVRPKVDERNFYSATQAQMDTIRQKLIQLSYKGLVIFDGLQVGFDRHGRPLIYDLGGVEDAKSWATLPEIFAMNNQSWKRFLYDVGKIRSPDDKNGLAKYGEVKMTLSRVS
jgi:hypothetical protein